LIGYETPDSPAAAWEAEAAKPLRDRQLFRFWEVGRWLARAPGRIEADCDEARGIVEDIFHWYERGEFDPSDVLVPLGDPPYFRSVDSFLKSSPDPQEQATRAQEIHSRPIVDFLILRRPALGLYLSQCGLGGAARLARELGFEEPAAVPEPVMREGAGDISDRPAQEASFEEAGARIATVPVLKEWIFARHPRPPTSDTPLACRKLLAAARRDPQLGTFSEADFLVAYRSVYATKSGRPLKKGWPLQPEYRRHLEEESRLQNKV
jgi:hypothetical protein